LRFGRSFLPGENCYAGQNLGRRVMKRYLIFAALVPLIGGFCLLLTTTIMSG
jgi:hypothetical protein